MMITQTCSVKTVKITHGLTEKCNLRMLTPPICNKKFIQAFNSFHHILQVFGDEANTYNLEDIQINDFGKVAEVNVTKDDTLMMKVQLNHKYIPQSSRTSDVRILFRACTV